MAINKMMRAALKALSYPDLDLKNNYKLARTFEKISHPPLLPVLYKRWDHRIVVDEHEVPVRLYPFDERVRGLPVLLFFHGGGWVTGDIDSYDRVCHDLAVRTKHLVVSVDYRLAPEHPFPAGLQDCYAITRALMLNFELLDTNRITLIGDSAGANLAAAVSLMARDRGEFDVQKQILLYPAVYNDHSARSPYRSVVENGTDYLLTSKRVCDFMDLYESSPADRKNPYFAPILAKDFHRLPDTLVITAEYDPLRDEGEDFARRLAEAGDSYVELHRMKDALHGFFRLPERYPHVKRTYRAIRHFLHREVRER